MAYEDLLKDNSVAVENGNYFILTITDLDLNENYPIQFRWKYQDGSYGLWSASKLLTTIGETLPGSPNLSLTDVVGGDGFIQITWNGNDKSGRPVTDIDRVDIFIDGAPFDGTKPAGSFKTAGTQTIVAPSGQYAVALYAISNYGNKSAVSDAQSVLVIKSGQSILNPENPTVPAVKSGLASVIVEWDGKKNDGLGGAVDFTSGSFAGAKIFIGTSPTFTPTDNNWVHTLNFANGSNKASIGVGTVIDKSSGATLQYNTPYYIKMDTVNAIGTANGQPVSASNNPVTVSKLPASEISTGILTADASVTAGVSGGQRVVISGGSSPFIIYGTDGTTKLLEYVASGTAGTLAIKGSGTFTGTIDVGSGNDIFKADPSIGIWLGNSNFLNAPFAVSKSGYLTATYGEIGGWQIAGSYLQNIYGTLKINSGTDPSIYLGSASGAHIRMAPDSITHYNGGSPTGKFTLTTSNGNVSLSGDITAGSRITGAEISGGNIDGSKIQSSGTAPGGYTGILTIDSGYITHTTGVIIDAPFMGMILQGLNITVANEGYFYLGNDGSVVLGQGNATGDLQIRTVTSNNAEGWERGFHLSGIEDFPLNSTQRGVYPFYRTVYHDIAGKLMSGRALLYGSSGTSSAINTEVPSGRVGDLYFSTS
jgi:hypothetical protein